MSSTISRVDGVNLKTWTFSIVCNLATFVNVVFFVVLAHFPNLGFPCAYYRLVDLNDINLTEYNKIHFITPQLFLSGGQMIAFVAQDLVVFGIVCAYYVYCLIRMYRRPDPGPHVNQTTRDINILGDSTCSFLFTVTMNTFQLFIVTLAFRLPTLVAFTCTLHFIALVMFTLRLITQYAAAEQTAFALTKIHPSLNGTIKFKTFIANTMENAVGCTAVMTALSLGVGLGNALYVTSATVMFATLNVFGVIMLVYFITIETILHHYMKVTMGFHLGSLFGLGMIAYPIICYESIYASEFATAVIVNLVIIALVWLIFVIVRLVRFFLRRQRRYRMLPSSDEVKALTNNSPIVD